MIRTRTALIATTLAAATAAGGVAVAGADDRDDASPAVEYAAPAAPAADDAADDARFATQAGDDGLTHAQATKARSAALERVAGRAVQIERDDDDGRVDYEVKVLTPGGQAREVRLDRSFRVTRVVREDRDGLTYASAGKAASAATKRVKGLVTGIDVDDDDRARYEVEVLTSRSVERTVHLSSSFRVVTDTDDDGDDD